jgi:hypothetical protein
MDYVIVLFAAHVPLTQRYMRSSSHSQVPFRDPQNVELTQALYEEQLTNPYVICKRY